MGSIPAEIAKTAVKTVGEGAVKVGGKIGEKIKFFKDIAANPDGFKISLYFEGECLVIKIKRKSN